MKQKSLLRMTSLMMMLILTIVVLFDSFCIGGTITVKAEESQTKAQSSQSGEKAEGQQTARDEQPENESQAPAVEQDSKEGANTAQNNDLRQTESGDNKQVAGMQEQLQNEQQDDKQENKTEPTTASGPDISSPSAILMESSTGQIIFEKNADEKLHPASITKIMTLLLIFDALADGKINLSDEVVVSEHAASMGGSQVYLEPNETQTVETMIKCISMASANDACVSMAEYIDGTEEAFVKHMNERAKSLGMTNTTFVNCCGLDADGHMSSAKDVALMSRELINKYPEIHNYSTVWMDTITHVTKKGETEFGLTNTNKLIKQYQWANGLKTGSTGLAKCCLSGTAEKDGINLIAVIMAAPNSKTRFSDAITLLNFGFSKCDIYHDENMPELSPVVVANGQKDTVACEYKNEFSYMFLDHIDTADIRSEIQMYTNIQAPLAKGDVIGQICYYYKGEAIGYVDICASEDMKKASYGDSLLKMLNRILFKDAA